MAAAGFLVASGVNSSRRRPREAVLRRRRSMAGTEALPACHRLSMVNRRRLSDSAGGDELYDAHGLAGSSSLGEAERFAFDDVGRDEFGLDSMDDDVDDDLGDDPSGVDDEAVSHGTCDADGWCFGAESVEAAIAALARGECVVVTDDESRENEGDLIVAAEKATAETVAFIVRHTSGVVCVAMEGQDLDRLQLEPMVSENTDPKHTAFTISCDFRGEGSTTGISAADRSRTLAALADPASRARDFSRPGHIFPLRYRPGGVLKRAGHTEAAVDLARLAGLYPAGALCELVDARNGSMARMPYLQKFARRHGLVVTTIADLIRYRRQREKLVERLAPQPSKLRTRWGTFDAYGFRSRLDGVEHVALVLASPRRGAASDGPPSEAPSDSPSAAAVAAASAGSTVPFDADEAVLVRVHSECCTGDVLGSLRCDCGQQLDYAMQRIACEGRGCLLYLRGQEGRGIGIGHKVRAYALQDRGRDTVEANQELGLPVDSREYGIGSQILVDLGISQLRLMTNNPAKYGGIIGYGLRIVQRLPVLTAPNPENLAYLRAKREKLGHWLGEMDPLSMPTTPATAAKIDAAMEAVAGEVKDDVFGEAVTERSE